MSDKRECYNRIGEGCAKASVFRHAVVTNTPRAGETAEQTAARTAPRASRRTRLIEADSATRKTYPMCTGLLDYFPDALAEVAKVSFLGNAKHNPGEPMHHARGKSMDHPDCIARHLVERGGFDVVLIDGVEHKIRHSGSLAWRALALLQEEIEREQGLPLPRAARPAVPA
jgi:hypothetical protein